jgi:hypothetical protein
MLSAHKDRLWTLKQCKKYITTSHIARLWYCDDMDAIRDWMARWEFRMTACAIPQFALRCTEVIRFTRGDQNLPTCTYSNLSMVYAEVMLGKRVNWSTMTAHSRSHIIVDTIDIPTDVGWNGGLMQHAITNGLLRQGWAAAVETPRSPQVHMGMEDIAWDHHFTGGGEQYRSWESWDPQGREWGDQYRAWNDHNQGRAAQYTNVRSTWGVREGSYSEDHYPCAWRDVVDGIVHEEDFQDVHDENNHVPRYPSFHGNVYDRTERYPMSPPFRTSEWDDERELCTRTLGDDVNIRRGGGGNSSRKMNRDNQDIQGSHSWQGNTFTKSTSRAWNPWPFYDNL